MKRFSNRGFLAAVQPAVPQRLIKTSSGSRCLVASLGGIDEPPEKQSKPSTTAPPGCCSFIVFLLLWSAALGLRIKMCVFIQSEVYMSVCYWWQTPVRCEVYTLKKFERWISLEKLLEDCKDVQLKDYYYFIMTFYVSNVSIFNKAQYPARLSDIWALLQRPDYVQWQYLCKEFRIFAFSNICSCWLKKGSRSATERKLGTEINYFFCHFEHFWQQNKLKTQHSYENILSR